MTDTDLFVTHPDPAVRYQPEDTVVTALNPAFADQFGVSADEFVGQPLGAVLEAVGIQESPVEIAANADTAGLTAEMEATAADGRVYALRQAETDDGGYLLLTEVSTYADHRADLEAANDRLDRFARTVSHDLRNPLEVAQSRLAAARETGDEQHFEKAAAAHSRISQLIEDVLTLARSGTAISETEEIDLAATATEAWQHIDAEAATLSVGEDLEPITADPERLQTLFENLYRNAVAYAGHDVVVTVEACENGFVVADDGPGIPPERRDTVFEAGTTTGEETTGLGLSIVSEIAAAHGWGVSLTESSDGGAQFEFRTAPS